jgi:hypothetical protein
MGLPVQLIDTFSFDMIDMGEKSYLSQMNKEGAAIILNTMKVSYRDIQESLAYCEDMGSKEIVILNADGSIECNESFKENVDGEHLLEKVEQMLMANSDLIVILHPELLVGYTIKAGPQTQYFLMVDEFTTMSEFWQAIRRIEMVVP